MPLSVADNIPLSCKGNDYGVIGNELLVSDAEGRSYGVEIMFKWLLAKKLNLSSSLTFSGVSLSRLRTMIMYLQLGTTGLYSI